MSLIIPQREVWTRQPNTPQRIARDDPLTRGLIGLYGSSAQGMLQNLVIPSRKLTPSGSGASIGLSDRGRVLRLDGSSYFQDQEFSTATTVGRTMACWVRLNALPASNANVIVWTDGGLLSIEQLSITSAGVVRVECYRSGSAGVANTAGAVTVGKWHFIAAVMPSDASRTAWLDTESVTVTSSAGTYGTDKWLTIGAAPWASYTDTVNGDVLLPMVWDRGLSPAEIRAVRENSWRLIEPEELPVLVALGAGASYTDSLTDTGAATDSATTVLSALGTISDSGALTDAASSALAAVDALTDSGALTETAASVHVAVDALADSAASTDAATAAVSSTQALADTGAASDSASSVLSAVDALADSAAASETVATALSAVDALADSAAATDSATDSLSSSTYTDALTDTVAASDAFSTSVAFVDAITDTAAATDSFGTAAVLADLLSDLAAGSDITVGLVTTTQAIADTADATDEATGVVGAQSFTDLLTDSLVATDAFADSLRAVGVRGGTARADTSHRLRADTASRHRGSGSSRARRV